MRIFVTGATGVIGRRAIPLMVAAGHQVTAIGRAREVREQLERAGATTAQLDLFDHRAVEGAMAGHDVVVNLATHIPRGPVRPLLPAAWRENDQLRKQASALLVDAALAAGVQRFVQESFALIYPDSGTAWISEETAPRVVRTTRTVLDAEASAMRFGREGGSHVVLRFALLYGPGDPWTRVVCESVRHGFLPLFGAPQGFVSVLHQEDAARAVVTALSLPGGISTVVDDEPVTRRQLGEALARMLHVAPPRLAPPWLQHWSGAIGELMARSLRISNGKLRTVSHWAPRYPSVREGFRAALQERSSVPIAP